VPALEVDRLAVQEPLDDRERLLRALELLATDGQRIPAGTSFIASPDPTPRNARPGQSASSVATCWATTTGL
jgi:hypothetical protein